MLNNVEVDQDYIIGNSDVIEIINVNKLLHLIELYEIDAEYYSFYSEGVKIDLDTILNDGMKIDLVQDDLVDYMDNLDNNQTEQDLQGIENTIITETIAEVNAVEINKNEVNSLDDKIYVNLNDKIIELKVREDKTPYIFADMLTFTDIDPSNPQGDLIILHNGDGASYTGIINDGDTITIKWGN